MVSKNTKQVVAVVVVVVLVLALALGLYFGLRNTKGHHTSPTNPQPTPTNPQPTPTNKPPAPVPTLPSDAMVVYQDAEIISDGSVPVNPICKNMGCDTYKIESKKREIISYKQNSYYPPGQIYLSNDKRVWFKYNMSNGTFELYSSGTNITQFTGKILGALMNNNYLGVLLVYLPFSQLPASIKSLWTYDLKYDYYQLFIHTDTVDLAGTEYVDVVTDLMCMKDSNPPTFTLDMYNPTTTTTHHK